MKIGIIVAMEKELKQLRTLITNEREETYLNKSFYIGDIMGKEIVALQCGIGKVNSAIGAVEMIRRYSPDLVVSTGVAGGTGQEVNIMDVVMSTECCYHDAYCGKDCLPGQIMGMPQRFKSADVTMPDISALDSNLHRGLIVSGDQFIDNKDDIRKIMNTFPEAMAVDMESTSIAHTCHIYGVSFVSFRIISDCPLKDTDASQYYDFWDRLAEGSFLVTKRFIEGL